MSTATLGALRSIVEVLIRIEEARAIARAAKEAAEPPAYETIVYDGNTPQSAIDEINEILKASEMVETNDG